MTPTVRPFGPGDRAWAEALLVERMGSARAVRLGELVDPLELPGFVAEGPAERGCRRLWLVATNDNLHALGFYQRRRPRPGPRPQARAPRGQPGQPHPMRDLLELELPLG